MIGGGGSGGVAPPYIITLVDALKAAVPAGVTVTYTTTPESETDIAEVQS